jgi:hypothetical protein
MTLDDKIEETATHVAPYVRSIARVVIAIALMFMETWDLEAVWISRAIGHPARSRCCVSRRSSRSSAARYSRLDCGRGSPPSSCQERWPRLSYEPRAARIFSQSPINFSQSPIREMLPPSIA